MATLTTLVWSNPILASPTIEVGTSHWFDTVGWYSRVIQQGATASEPADKQWFSCFPASSVYSAIRALQIRALQTGGVETVVVSPAIFGTSLRLSGSASLRLSGLASLR